MEKYGGSVADHKRVVATHTDYVKMKNLINTKTKRTNELLNLKN